MEGLRIAEPEVFYLQWAAEVTFTEAAKELTIRQHMYDGDAE